MYRQIILNFLKQYIFWMLFFVLNRLVFLIFTLFRNGDYNGVEIFQSFWYALPLDNSTACYLLALPFLILLLQSLLPFRFFSGINSYYTYLIIFIISVITSSELGIYDEWRVKLNYKALTYLERPGEVVDSAKGWIIVVVLFFILLQSFIGIWVYQQWFRTPFNKFKVNFLASFLFLIIIPPLLFGGIRGGVQPIPINQSNVTFSKNHFINTLTVNSVWNLFYSIEQNKGYIADNPFKYMPDSTAKRIVDSLHFVAKDTSEMCLNNNGTKINLMVIILESWSSDAIKPFGGYDSITPYFNRMANDGLIFKNTISTGTVSDQGICGILSGYPAQPTVSIIKQDSKYSHLPCLITSFQNDGYYSSFFFGGQLNYGNIKSYIVYNRFDDIYEGEDFNANIPRCRLGVADEFLFQRIIDETNKVKEPFATFAFTLSSHSPYDFPMKEVIHWGGDSKQFFNSMYYTDSCIGDFMNKARLQSWYKNTLFVFIADHSHHTPKGQIWYSAQRRRIPLLLYGDVLKSEYRGRVIEKYFSQIDITSTLLIQFGYDASKFYWSKNMLNPLTKEFAYYSFDNGIGWVSPPNYFCYDHDQNSYHEQIFNDASKKDADIRNGKAYLQVLFEEYTEY